MHAVDVSKLSSHGLYHVSYSVVPRTPPVGRISTIKDEDFRVDTRIEHRIYVTLNVLSRTALINEDLPAPVPIHKEVEIPIMLMMETRRLTSANRDDGRRNSEILETAGRSTRVRREQVKVKDKTAVYELCNGFAPRLSPRLSRPP